MTDFSQTFNVSTNPAHNKVAAHGDNIAKLARNQDDLITDLNTMLDLLEGGPMFIPFCLDDAREVDANGDVANIAANGGILASDTTPISQSNSPASDGDNAQVLAWAASNSDPIRFQTALDPNINVGADLEIHFRIKSAGTTDAVGFDVESWFNEGDTKVADISGTNQTATVTEVTATIAAADIPAGSQTLTFTIAPVAHTTDIMYLYGVWIEGTKSMSLL